MTVAPAFLQLAALSDDEQAAVARLANKLAGYYTANANHRCYYEAEQVTRDFGISIPPQMRSLRAVAGWGGTVVDVLEERLDLLGWRGDEAASLGLVDAFDDNHLDVDAGQVTLDALIFGVSYAALGSGDVDEPPVLITAASPETTTGTWDARRRRLSEAMTQTSDDMGRVTEVTLYLPEQTIRAVNGADGWRVVDRDPHNLGRVPVVAFPNRARGSRQTGRSEISNAVRYYTDAAVRTLLGLEVHREFYQAPQRYGLGLSEDDFVDADGNKVSPWTTIMGRMLAIPRDEDGELPQVGQFTPASPTPYMDQVRGWAQLLAAEAGMPVSYLGQQTDNPASADAIRAGEARLVKRAERRQRVFGRSWLEVAHLAAMIAAGGADIPAELMRGVSVYWGDPSTPTRAAAADEATKLVGAGILPAESSVTLDRVGLSPDEQRQLRADRRRAQGQAALRALIAQPPAAPGSPAAPTTTPPTGAPADGDTVG